MDICCKYVYVYICEIISKVYIIFLFYLIECIELKYEIWELARYIGLAG